MQGNVEMNEFRGSEAYIESKASSEKAVSTRLVMKAAAEYTICSA